MPRNRQSNQPCLLGPLHVERFLYVIREPVRLNPYADLSQLVRLPDAYADRENDPYTLAGREAQD